VLAGADSLGVFVFSDDGDSLGSRNDGLTNLHIHALTKDNNEYVYVGTDNGVWRRPFSELTSMEGNATDLPSQYFLSQNYPNPFNPSTTIDYALPGSAQVKLEVFNILGERVSVLRDGVQDAGYHSVVFEAAGLPSGIYFYRLQAGDFVETKKLLLLR
jgi:hypothetical protein